MGTRNLRVVEKSKRYKGEIHEFLGMVLDFSVPWVYHVKQSHHVKEIIDEWPDLNKNKTVLPPASKTPLRRRKADC